MQMDVETVKKEMDGLERSWFAAHRAAVAAQQELASRSFARIGASIFWGLLGGAVAAGVIRAVMRRPQRKSDLQSAQARFEEADRRKQEIMREIEALEGSLAA
jgi:hypothetical protein